MGIINRCASFTRDAAVNIRLCPSLGRPAPHCTQVCSQNAALMQPAVLPSGTVDVTNVVQVHKEVIVLDGPQGQVQPNQFDLLTSDMPAGTLDNVIFKYLHCKYLSKANEARLTEVPSRPGMSAQL